MSNYIFHDESKEKNVDKETTYKIAVSQQGFTAKPERNQIGKIQYKNYDLTVNRIVDCVLAGAALSSQFIFDGIYSQSDRTERNFKYTSVVMIDVDDCQFNTIDELIEGLVITPTIAYETFSHKIKGNRYRLLYIFKQPIETISQYKGIYKEIVAKNFLKLKDNCGASPVQLYFGTKPTAKFFYSPVNVYDLSDFEESVTGENEDINDININSMPLKQRAAFMRWDGEVDANFKEDFFKMSYSDFEEKYKKIYPPIESTPFEMDDNSLYTILPQPFYQISRYVINMYTKRDNGITELVKSFPSRVSVQRRRKMFVWSQCRRAIKTDITIEHLLANLIYDMNSYVKNNLDDKITKRDLVKIAYDSMSCEIGKYCTPITKQYVINHKYCADHEISNADAIRMARSDIKNKQLDMYYDPNVSIRQNVMQLKAKGIKIGQSKVAQYAKDRKNK